MALLITTMLVEASKYSKSSLLILAAPDVFAFAGWIYAGQEAAVEYGIYLQEEKAFMLLLLWIIVSFVSGLYHPARYSNRAHMLAALSLATTALLFLLCFWGWLGVAGGVHFTAALIFCLLMVLASAGAKMLLWLTYHLYHRWSEKSASFVMLGYSPESEALVAYLKNLGNARKFLGYFDDEVKAPEVQGGLSELEAFCREREVHSLYVCGRPALDLDAMYHFANREYMHLHYMSADWLPEGKKGKSVTLEGGLHVLLYAPSASKYLLNKWQDLRPSKRKLATATQ